MWFVFNLDLKTKYKPFSKADICTGGVLTSSLVNRSF